MKKHLIVDVGNTCTKMAYVRSGKLETIHRCSGEETESRVLEMLRKEDVDTVVLSSVKAVRPDWEETLKGASRKYVRFDSLTPTNLVNGYATPQTLGADRLAAAVGARVLFPDQPLLIIDFGTAITMDRVSREGVFEGGNISLGLKTRFRALHEYTGKLPLLDPPVSVSEIGHSTQTAIENGVVLGIIFEVEGYLRRFPEYIPIFTGGDAFYFAEKLKTPIFAVYNLVLTGLAYVAEKNAIQ